MRQHDKLGKKKAVPFPDEQPTLERMKGTSGDEGGGLEGECALGVAKCNKRQARNGLEERGE